MVKRDVKKFLDAGRQLLEAGKVDKAIQLYKSAVKADEGCALCHFNLGYAYHEQGLQDEAKARYQKAIELEPTCSLFIEHLARLFFEANDYTESIKLFQRASLVGPIQPISLGLWGRALFEQGLYDQAIDAFERLLDEDDQPTIQLGANYWRTLAHMKLGNIAAARRIAEQLIEQKNMDHKILFELGEYFIEARCLTLARRIFERIVIEKEELMLARMRLEDIRALEEKIDELLPKLYDADEEMVLHHIHTLREFGNDRISKAFLTLILSPSAPVRESVVLYQTQYGYDVTDAIKPLLNDPVSYVRDAAYDYMVRLDRPTYLHTLLNGLNDPLVTIRKKAARYIGRFGTMEALPLLEMSLEDPDCKDCWDDLRRAVLAIKHRYQKNMDSLYYITIQEIEDPKSTSWIYDWRRWLLFLFQVSALIYFIYYLLSNF